MLSSYLPRAKNFVYAFYTPLIFEQFFATLSQKNADISFKGRYIYSHSGQFPRRTNLLWYRPHRQVGVDNKVRSEARNARKAEGQNRQIRLVGSATLVGTNHRRCDSRSARLLPRKISAFGTLYVHRKVWTLRSVVCTVAANHRPLRIEPTPTSGLYRIYNLTSI